MKRMKSSDILAIIERLKPLAVDDEQLTTDISLLETHVEQTEQQVQDLTTSNKDLKVKMYEMFENSETDTKLDEDIEDIKPDSNEVEEPEELTDEELADIVGGIF